MLLTRVEQLSAPMQAIVLHFLELSQAEGRTPFRVIAATDRRTLDRVKTRQFRQDLFCCLNAIQIVLPESAA
jgi:DNA-binding NtrC family response regulator